MLKQGKGILAVNRKYTFYHLISYLLIIGFSYTQTPQIKKYLIYDDFSIPKKLYPYLDSKTSKTNRRAHAILHETLYEGKKNKIINKGAISKENDYEILINLDNKLDGYWKFSDGSIISALDIKASIELSKIYDARMRARFGRIQIINDEDLIITLTTNVPIALVKEDLRNVKVIPSHVVSSFLDEYHLNPQKPPSPYKYKEIKNYSKSPKAVSGPFALYDKSNTEMLFTLNDKYIKMNQSEYKLRGIKVRKQTLGSEHFQDLDDDIVNLIIDMPWLMISQAGENDAFVINRIPTHNVSKLLFNIDKKDSDRFRHLGNRNLRRAITHIIDRVSISYSKLSGTANLLNGPFWSGSPLNSSSANKLEYDITKAQNLINKIDNYRIVNEKNKDAVKYKGEPVTLTIIRMKGLHKQENDAIDVIKQQLDKFGFIIEDKTISKFNWTNFKKTDSWDIAFETTHQDISSNISLEYETDGRYNYSGYSHTGLDELFTAFASCATSPCRKEFASEITNHLNSNAVSMFLWTLDYYYVVNRNYLDYNTIDQWVNGYDFFTHPEKWLLKNKITN